MPQTPEALAQEQVDGLRQVVRGLLYRAIGGDRAVLEDYFAAQAQLEHWMSYLAGYGPGTSMPGDAPPPSAEFRPAPPLRPMYEPLQEPLAEEFAEGRITFPPNPFFDQPPQGLDEEEAPHP